MVLPSLRTPDLCKARAYETALGRPAQWICRLWFLLLPVNSVCSHTSASCWVFKLFTGKEPSHNLGTTYITSAQYESLHFTSCTSTIQNHLVSSLVDRNPSMMTHGSSVRRRNVGIRGWRLGVSVVWIWRVACWNFCGWMKMLEGSWQQALDHEIKSVQKWT